MKRIIALTLALSASLNLLFSGPAKPVGSSPPKRLSGLPFYHVYEEKEIANSSRGNFITTAPDNTLFFGSERGIHTFDGTSWKLLLETETTRNKIRALYWADGDVYASSYGTIGKLSFDPGTGVRYERLNKEPLSDNASEHYHEILGVGNWLYFLGLRSVAIYDTVSGAITTKTFTSWVKTGHVKEGALYVTTDRDGMWKIRGNKMELEPAFSSFVEGETISVLAQSPQGKIAFRTQDGGLYRVLDGRPIPAYRNFAHWNKADIIDMEFIDEDRLALTLSGHGVYILDDWGNELAAIDKTVDYRWSAARYLHVDEHGTLWTMFNASIGKIITGSPLTSIDERLRPSLEYPIAHIYQDDLYLRNNGRLYRATHYESGRLSGFENALPQYPVSVAVALSIDETLYVHAGPSTYLHQDGELVEIGESSHLDRLTSSRSDPNQLLGVSSTHARLFKREGSSLVEMSNIAHTAGLVNKIARDKNDVFWLEIGLGRVGKLWIQDGRLQFKLYDESHGLPPDWIATWEHEGTVLFTDASGVHTYDEAIDRFARSDLLEAYLPRAKGPIHRVSTDHDGNIWASHDSHNYILWKQPDGSYELDSGSLSLLGDLYFHQFLHLENGDALLLTASEIFHFDSSQFGASRGPAIPRPNLVEISSFGGSRIHLLGVGFHQSVLPIKLNSGEENLSVRVSNTYSAILTQPSFQYLVEGMSREWSKWSNSNQFDFTHVEHGSYTLRIRTRVREQAESVEIALPFKIPPSFWETPLAILLYTAGGALLLFAGFSYLTRNLKSANERLEQMVAERTGEIESKNAELKRNARELTTTLNDLRIAQDQLMTTSRKAGMAEVATNVLHNVGNVLNSINVGINALAESLEQQRVDKLGRVSELIDSHRGDLGAFFTTNPKGKAVPDYLRQLAQVLSDDFSRYRIEVQCINENIDHVKRIISTQQAHARIVDIYQPINLPELIDSAIMMIVGEQAHSKVEIVRDFDGQLEIVSDKHRILQMIANFIKNADESIAEADVPLGVIQITGRFDQSREHVRIDISDNGLGIDEENLNKIFTHGFTTKNDGHGFGMHSCANSAKVIGGELLINSEGIGLGATVTLILPVNPPRLNEQERAPKKPKRSLAQI